jgi:hypothetical protein
MLAAALLAWASLARGETTIPVGTDPGSNIAIKISSPCTTVPRFGFMPVRVTIENLTARDGVWDFRFTAGSPTAFPGMVASQFTVTVPSPQTREVWLFVPLAEPGLSSSGIPSATAVAAGMMPTPVRAGPTPPTIAGVYPTSPPGVRPPVLRSSRTTGGSSGVTISTFTIEQTGPAAALPPVPASALPPGSRSTVSAPNAAGEVTRTTELTVTTRTASTGGIPTPYSATRPPQTVAMTNARAKLAAANLSPLGIASRSSGQSGPPTAAGTAEFTVTIVQTGPASVLKLPDVKMLPPGFTSVTVNPTGRADEVTREFTYVETIAATVSRPVTLPVGAGGPTTTSLPLGEKEARALLAPTGLLNPPASVRTSVETRPGIVSTSSGAPTMMPIVFFDQTGPAADLPVPSSGLPDNVRVTLHPTAVAGTVKRVISVVDPTLLANLRASVAATSTTSVSYIDRSNLARIEVMRLGYLRPQAGVQTGTQTRYSGGRPVPGGPDLFIHTESGPANLLPPVSPASLPPGITSNITPGILPGEVSRNFVVNINALVRISAVAGGLAVRRGSVAPRPSPTPLPPTPLAVEINGPGLSTPARATISSAATSSLPPMAVAFSLEAPLRSKLVSGGVRTLPNLTAIEPTVLPADWRVWSGFNTVLLRADDFAALDAGRRAALRGWVALGGVLVLSPGVAGAADERVVEHYGAGRIETLAKPLADLPAASVLDDLPLTTLSPGLPDRDTLFFAPGTAMADLMSYERASVLWLCLFLIAFAVLVGPINLFVFAPAARRHRLFVTTPLLSLGGAAAVAAAIVLQDGFGGDGSRRAVVVLAADDNQAAVFQEQAAHTGFLLGRQFALDETVACAAMPDNSYMPVLSALRLERENRAARGDWFRNRSRQAHLLRALVPTRARVELVGTAPGGAPIVESTLTTELRSFRLRDENGRFWTADAVGTGRRVTLHAESPAEAPAPAASPNENGTANLAAIVEALAPQAPWQWTARGGATELAPIATLRGIRWKDDEVDYAGTAAAAGKMPVAATTPVEKARP